MVKWELFLWKEYHYKYIPSDDKKTVALELWRTFIASDAPLMLNLDSQVYNKVKVTIASLSVISIDELNQDLFRVLKKVEIVMSDTFSRFKLEKSYLQYNEAKEAIIQTQQELGWVVK